MTFCKQKGGIHPGGLLQSGRKFITMLPMRKGEFYREDRGNCGCLFTRVKILADGPSGAGSRAEIIFA